jgi:hypothetical protein
LGEMNCRLSTPHHPQTSDPQPLRRRDPGPRVGHDDDELPPTHQNPLAHVQEHARQCSVGWHPHPTRCARHPVPSPVLHVTVDRPSHRPQPQAASHPTLVSGTQTCWKHPFPLSPSCRVELARPLSLRLSCHMKAPFPRRTRPALQTIRLAPRERIPTTDHASQQLPPWSTTLRSWPYHLKSPSSASSSRPQDAPFRHSCGTSDLPD